MIDLLFSPALPWGLAAGGAVFAALTGAGRRPAALWTFLAGLCAASGVLATLLQGGGLEDTLPAVLLIAAAALLAPGQGKGGGAG